MFLAAALIPCSGVSNCSNEPSVLSVLLPCQLLLLIRIFNQLLFLNPLGSSEFDVVVLEYTPVVGFWVTVVVLPIPV
jgi:hypothetical protein